MNYNKAFFEKAYGISSQLEPSDSVEIAFAGRSNVGKSSLLNKIFNRKSLARVSSVPGKTITINFYDVDSVKFVDLPGYGYAKISKEEKERFGELMEGYFKSGRNIKLVVQLVDMRHKPSNDDFGMLDFMKEMNIPFIIVMTKADKLNKTQFKQRLEESKKEFEEYENAKLIPFSSQNGLGLNEVKSEIEKAIEN
ncbi:MAG: YihA family ribosome biogenesis GTP-binding protein [Eubacterium sp.]|nr:YihA family ribosome biogenesis GTP-binding protein [Eubacterium sp.]MBR7060211.1 YihA family ribosome biogenesis GTP-binding protein [Eubacterium sp.]